MGKLPYAVGYITTHDVMQVVQVIRQLLVQMKANTQLHIQQLYTPCTALEHHLPKSLGGIARFGKKDDMDRRDKN